MSAAQKPIRIKCTDQLRNVTYIYKGTHGWGCALANGMGASFHYAGVLDDPMALKFALEDATTPEEALAAVQQRGGRNYTYELA